MNVSNFSNHCDSVSRFRADELFKRLPKMQVYQLTNRATQ